MRVSAIDLPGSMFAVAFNHGCARGFMEEKPER